MKHEFISIKFNEIPDQTTYLLMKGRQAVIVDDCVIGNNKLFLKGFKTFKVSFNNPGEGLDYCGNTIIPTTSLQDFIGNLIQAREIKVIPERTFKGPDGEIIKSKAKKIKPEIYSQLDELIALCKQAIDNEMYLIHFGL